MTNHYQRHWTSILWNPITRSTETLWWTYLLYLSDFRIEYLYIGRASMMPASQRHVYRYCRMLTIQQLWILSMMEEHMNKFKLAKWYSSCNYDQETLSRLSFPI